jgi:ATP-binding cassette subfamily B protein
MRAYLGTMWHVFRLTRRAGRRGLVAALALTAAQAGAVAALAVSMRWLVDSVVVASPVGVVVAAVLGAMAYGVTSAGDRVLNNLLLYLTGRVELALTQEVIEAVSAVPTVEHLEDPAYLNRLDRTIRGASTLSWLFWSSLSALAALASLGASLWLLGRVDPVLCLLALLGLPPLVSGRHADRLLTRARDESAELLRAEQRLHELCTSAEPAKEIRIAGAGAELTRRAGLLLAAAADRETAARVRGGIWQLAGWLCYSAGFAGALWVTVRLGDGGRATVGDVALVITIATQLQGQLARVLEQFSAAAEAGRVVDHYRWLLRWHADGSGGAPPSRLDRGIELSGVSYRYPGADRDALHDMSVLLPAGSTVAVVGPNGAGKTTLVRLLTGLYTPTLGTVSVDGRPLSNVDLRGWHADLSAVFQDYARLQTRVRETVGVGDIRRLTDRVAVAEAIHRAGAEEIVAGLPDGIETELGRAFGGTELSTGQWQRLALARAMMRPEPLLTVLDEPTAALDPQAEYEVFHRFMAQGRAAGRRRGAVTLLVSHRYTTASMADLIVVVDRGGIVETGTHAQLLAAGGEYADLYHLQARSFANG